MHHWRYKYAHMCTHSRSYPCDMFDFHTQQFVVWVASLLKFGLRPRFGMLLENMNIYIFMQSVLHVQCSSFQAYDCLYYHLGKGFDAEQLCDIKRNIETCKSSMSELGSSCLLIATSPTKRVPASMGHNSESWGKVLTRQTLGQCLRHRRKGKRQRYLALTLASKGGKWLFMWCSSSWCACETRWFL